MTTHSRWFLFMSNDNANGQPIDDQGLMKSSSDEFLLEKYKLDRAHEVALNNAVAAYEHANLRTLLILNGGSATAYLALFGSIYKDNTNFFDRNFVLYTVFFWLAGVVTAGAATWCAYMSQVRFTRAYFNRRRAYERRCLDGHDLIGKMGLPKHKNGSVYSEEEINEKSGKVQKRAKRWGIVAKTFGGLSLMIFVVGVFFAILSMGELDSIFSSLLEQIFGQWPFQSS